MSVAAGPRLHGEIESPRPLRAPQGKVSVTGWCLAEDIAEPPAVRLVVAGRVLPATGCVARSDVSLLLPGQPAAARCGFTIEGRLAGGVYPGTFEAQASDGSWHAFKRLSLAVEPPAIAASVESPTVGTTIRQRVHVEGWALHPSRRIMNLALRYGHQELACILGGRRDDVPRLHPGAPHAAESGFRSQVILSAGRGSLRLKARLDDGSIVITRTALAVDVPVDENVGPEIDLAGARNSLPACARVSDDPPGVKAARPLNILFVLHGSFASNSALQVAALANELAAIGHACAIAVPRDLETLNLHRAPLFRGLLFAEAERGVTFVNGRGPDLVHAWTTRENVRQLTGRLRERHEPRIVVHLEDNEREILAVSLGRNPAELEKLSAAELDRLVPADLSHPRRGPEFLATADGVTGITDRLRDFAPAGRPFHTIWPAADARYFFPRPLPVEFRRLLDVALHTTVLFYHGNVHASNAAEVRELYTAVLRLNQEGRPVTLIRAGLNQVDCLGDLARDVGPFVLELGQIPHHRHLPPLMALADIFVQPGAPDAFNNYRFPSKLPEFFSLGRPVVLPRANFGTILRHRIDAYVLDRADAAGIAAAVRELRDDRALYDRLAAGAVAIAAQHFNWPRSAEALASFYSTLTD
jgi:glycosyltransferase involved in cell wall biosynthesis